MVYITTQQGKDYLKVQKLAGEVEGIVQHPRHFYKIMADHFGDTFFVAKEDKTEMSDVLGYLMGFLSNKMKDHLFLWQIAVSEKAQGQGIGSKLLKHSIKYAQNSEECKAILATVDTDNLASQHLFEKMNFKIASECFKGFEQELIVENGKEAIIDYYSSSSGTNQIFYVLKLD